MPMIEEGTQAPDFTLPDQDGNPVTLSDLRGQTVVVYFCPKADTRTTRRPIAGSLRLLQRARSVGCLHSCDGKSRHPGDQVARR